MKKYHVATGDGKGYYGCGYESYSEAKELSEISQRHDPQAHIVEEEQHFTNADHIRAMTDEELAEIIMCPYCIDEDCCNQKEDCLTCCEKWLQQPYERPTGQKG